MSFATNKPAGGATPPAAMLRAARRASVPVSRAQVTRGVRLHRWLALGVGCLVGGGVAGYALSGWVSHSTRSALLAAALPLGAICGVVAALLRHMVDAKIYGEADIDELMGLRPLAVLPARGEVGSGAYEAHVLRLAGAIAGARRSRGAKTFLLTAVSAGTNIEPLLSALRRKLEETGFQVVVAGVGDLLEPVPKMISGGFVVANLALFTGEQRLVLVEGRPLLRSAETEFVAYSVDATILVVECAVTTRHELWRAASQLERMQVTGVGAVLEELPMRLADGDCRAAMEMAEKSAALRPAAAQASFGEAFDLPSAPVRPEAGRDPDQLPPREDEEAVTGPVLVTASDPEEKADDRTGDNARRPASGGLLREKMASELSEGRDSPESDGEPSMKRRTGWLGRLMGRNDEPTSILPASDDEDEGQAAPGGTVVEVPEEEDYSAPLATRLDQISRQRPAAGGRASRRLQIVPQDAPREIFVPSAGGTSSNWQAESSLRELNAPEPVLPAAAEAGALEAEEVGSGAATGYFVTPSDPIQAGFDEVLAVRRSELLAQQQWEWESGQAVEAEHPEPEAASSGDDRVGQPGRHTGYEVLASVPELRTPSEIAWCTHWQEPAHLAAKPVDEEQRHPAVELLPALDPQRGRQPVAEGTDQAADAGSMASAATPANEIPVQEEPDDIEPVLEEVSRHLTSGRWDPIPTLRPDSSGWRDRPSPMPPANPGAEQRRWTGEDQDLDAWRSGPPSGSGPRIDSLPEPLLTRQWGLLSKFQQSRISSGSRPAARTQEDEALSTNGKGLGNRV